MKIFAILPMVIKRIVNNLGLVFFNFLGLMTAVTLLSSLPMYADAINERGLQIDLAKRIQETRPRSSLLFQYNAGLGGGADPGLYDRLDRYILTNAEPFISLPLRYQSKYEESAAFRLFSPGTEAIQEQDYQSTIAFMSFARVTAFRDHIHIIDGRYPSPALTPEGEIEVLVTLETANKYAFKPGDIFRVLKKEGERRTESRIKVVGIWEAVNDREQYWFYRPWAFNNNLILPEESFLTNVQQGLAQQVGSAAWYLVFDAKDIHSTNAGRVLAGVVTLRIRATSILPGLRLADSPEDILQEYLWKMFVLRILLYVFSLPVIFIIFYYVILSSSMIVDRQRNEIAVLKSRGTVTFQVMGIYLIEGLVVSGAVVGLGPLVGMLVAQLIGKTYTFLSFINRAPLPVTLTPQVYRYALISTGIFLLASMIPALGAARHSVVTYRQSVSRGTEKPFYHRYFLDLILLIISLYGYYTLRGRGAIFRFEAAGGDPFKNPLLLLVPSIFILATAMFFTRFFPWLVEVLSRAGGRFFGISIMLGLRYIARMPAYHNKLVLLLMLTLALGTFSASAAYTLDQNYADQVYYRVGADARFIETGVYDEVSERWEFPSPERHLEVPGIQSYARAAVFEVEPLVGGRTYQQAQLLGVDRYDMTGVAWFRKDFAPHSLAALMNLLGTYSDMVLVSRSFANAYPVAPGDQVTLRLGNTDMTFLVGGIINYFPTLYPHKGHFFVANLDHIFDMVGESPYDIWVKTSGRIDLEYVVNELNNRDYIVIDSYDSRSIVDNERGDATRTGLFGLLSVGFIISALLTTLGFILYSFLSLRSRSIQLGILRAMGLSGLQLIWLVMFEQIFLVVSGTLVGTALGLVAGKLFLPFLQVATTERALVPPFVIQTAWTQVFRLYIIVGIALAVALAGMVWILLHIRIHQVVKLGEEQMI